MSEKIKNPLCPYCNTEMVSIIYEDFEDNGKPFWKLYWSCPCKTVLEIEAAYNKADKRIAKTTL